MLIRTPGEFLRKLSEELHATPGIAMKFSYTRLNTLMRTLEVGSYARCRSGCLRVSGVFVCVFVCVYVIVCVQGTRAGALHRCCTWLGQCADRLD